MVMMPRTPTQPSELLAIRPFRIALSEGNAPAVAEEYNFDLEWLLAAIRRNFDNGAYAVYYYPSLDHERENRHHGR